MKILENGKAKNITLVSEPGPDWSVCESCGKEKPDVEPFRHDSRPDGIMLCTDCADSIMEDQEKGETG